MRLNPKHSLGSSVLKYPLLNHLPGVGFYLEMLLSAVLQYPKLAGQKGLEIKALVFVSHLGHSGYFINKRYKREACSRCASNHTEGSIVTSFLRISNEQAFVLLPREFQYLDMSERDTPDIFWCATTNQNAKSQGSSSGAGAAAQPLQEIKTDAGSPQYPGL